MDLSRTFEVKTKLATLNSLVEDAENAVTGKVDATIAGRYFGDHLLNPEHTFLRALAVRHVARRVWREIQVLRDDDIVVTFADKEITSMQETAMALVTRFWKSPDAEDLKSALVALNT